MLVVGLQRWNILVIDYFIEEFIEQWHTSYFADLMCVHRCGAGACQKRPRSVTPRRPKGRFRLVPVSIGIGKTGYWTGIMAVRHFSPNGHVRYCS